jgi:hypothetical protein
MIRAKAVIDSLQEGRARVEALARLRSFRGELYECPSARADALFELADRCCARMGQ